jgi:leucyl aminopeptidase
MNFEIQKRALSTVIRDDLDALIVLWPSDDTEALTGQNPVVGLVKAALQHGDFEHKAGAVLSLYAHSGIKALKAGRGRSEVLFMPHGGP